MRLPHGLHFIPTGAPNPFPDETVLVRPVYSNPSGPVQGYEVIPEADSFTDRDSESFDDFLYEVYDASSTWIGSPLGANAAVGRGAALTSPTEKPIGTVQLETGTTNAGRAPVFQAQQAWLFGYANVRWAARFAIGPLSTVGEEYHICAGFHDAITGATLDATNGIYFKYNRLVTGNFWVVVTADNGVLTQTTTTIAPVASTFQVLEFELMPSSTIAGGGPVVYFRVDGVHAALHTTNVPIASTRYTGEGYRIVKTAGGTNRFANVDWRRHRIHAGVDR